MFSSVNYYSSLVLGLSAVVGCSSLLSRVKNRFQSAPVSWPSCRHQASLFMHGHGRAACPILLQILLLFQILGHRCRIFEGIKALHFSLAPPSSPTSIPPCPPFSPSLISLMVSVDVKHHVYLLIPAPLALTEI